MGERGRLRKWGLVEERGRCEGEGRGWGGRGWLREWGRVVVSFLALEAGGQAV